MEKKELEKQIIATIAKQLVKSPESITPETRFKEDLSADSLDIVEMLMNLEDEYGISIPDEDAVNLKNVGDVVNYIDAKK
ncbi:MAG: acyl carrier protein [Christensenellaceae bacterium]|jgi:acyl carrier protein|nr:acyl carrier protein [Christensenellaceae bacterium]